MSKKNKDKKGKKKSRKAIDTRIEKMLESMAYPRFKNKK